jgi:hypothetical protein
VRLVSLLAAAAFATPLLAQSAPSLLPDETPFLIPEPNLINWDISNRFSPFQALPDPAKTFSAFSFLPGETASAWHHRLWEETPDPAFASPYAPSLRSDAQTPWSSEQSLPSAPTLEWIRAESDADARINITLSYPHTGPCRWEAGETRILAPNCSQPTAVSIPRSGLAIAVRLGASPASATIFARPKHEVILGLGDSYASGEGNPDQPTVWANWFKPAAGDTRWLVQNTGIDQDPLWLDDTCNRSFFSYQSLAALRRASQDPHLLVSFVHLACTGAEIFNGLLAPQENAGGSETFLRYSQINAAQHALCRSLLGSDYHPFTEQIATETQIRGFARRNGTTLRLLDDLDVNTRQQRSETGLVEPRSGLLDCPQGQIRAPDHVFLSIGGNDIGFGDLVRYFLVPFDADLALLNSLVLPETCPDPAYRYSDPNLAITEHCTDKDRSNEYHSGSLISDPGDPAGFQARFALMVNAIRHYLEVSPDQIAMVQYPDPLRRGFALPKIRDDLRRPGANLELRAERSLDAGVFSAAGPSAGSDPCRRLSLQPDLVHGSPAGLDPLSPWASLSARDPLEITADWAFNLRSNEAFNLLRQFEALRISLTDASLDERITLACAGRDAFVGRGWWVGDKLNLPSHGPDPFRWSPSDWQPYAYDGDGRTVRTANDSFLTQKDVYGTAHPNLAGHAIMADILTERLGWQ